MVGSDGKRMLHEQAIGQGVPKHTKGNRDCEEPRHHHCELDSRLSRIPDDRPYKLLIPSEMAFHSSCSRGLNTVIASMAITTSTPTRIAYSVVPCPDCDLTKETMRDCKPDHMRTDPRRTDSNVFDNTPIASFLSLANH